MKRGGAWKKLWAIFLLTGAQLGIATGILHLARRQGDRLSWALFVIVGAVVVASAIVTKNDDGAS